MYARNLIDRYMNQCCNNYLLICFLDEPSLTDLCCFWCASNELPKRGGSILVKFDDGTSDLPYAETCFSSLTLPTKHISYIAFHNFMNIALKYGSLGIEFM